MKLRLKFTAALMLIIAAMAPAALVADVQKDQKALDVLQQMAGYTAARDHWIIRGEVYGDARLNAGLMVTNPAEVMIKFTRPNALVMTKFDGLATRKVYIVDGKLTVYNSQNNFYAQAAVPEDVKQAMQLALDDLGLDLPLAELFFADSVLELLTTQDQVLYLTDKSRIRGVDCHHIAVRGELADIQLWVAEGDEPAPRKVSITMKWEGGSPRHTAFMEWEKADGFKPETFEFVPPEGAQEIRFVGAD
jgi:hypothetical protein